jgi:hypothetical protein
MDSTPEACAPDINRYKAAEITPPSDNASSIAERLASVPSPDIHPTPFGSRGPLSTSPFLKGLAIDPTFARHSALLNPLTLRAIQKR